MNEPHVARDAAITALVSEGIFLAVAVGLTVWMTRREWLTLQARRLRAVVREDWRAWRTEREVTEFRRQVADYDHGDRAC